MINTLVLRILVCLTRFFTYKFPFKFYLDLQIVLFGDFSKSGPKKILKKLSKPTKKYLHSNATLLSFFGNFLSSHS